MILAAQAVPALIPRSALIATFVGVIVVSVIGLIGAIFNIATAMRRIKEVPTPEGSPERIVAQSLRRIGIGRVVMMAASLAFAVLALNSTVAGNFQMTADRFGISFLAAVCAPGLVTTVLTIFEMVERVRLDRIYKTVA